MKCSICHLEFKEGDKVAFNHQETFVWKPANEPDIPMMRTTTKGLDLPVPAAAVLSADELRETRKAHKRTAIATTYIEFGKAEIPPLSFGVRHVDCLQRTGAAGGFHAGNKHSVRWRNNQAGRKMH